MLLPKNSVPFEGQYYSNNVMGESFQDKSWIQDFEGVVDFP